MSILIVDDSDFITSQMKAIVRDAGFNKVITLNSAVDALTLLQINDKDAPGIELDLLLIDYEMPGLSGIEAIRIISSDRRYADTPIIMVTSLSEGEYAKEAFDVGAMDFIAKPINEIELITRIKAAFRIKHKYDAVKQREARLIKELELAKTIQQKVLTPPIDDENIKVDAIYRPSEELAGDMYAWFRIDDYRYGFILFDVSGQGISASLVGMSVRSLLRGVITKVVEPIGVIKELNKHVHTLFHEEDSRYYLTALYVVVDTEHKQIRYVNAGHPTGLLFSGNDSEIIELNKGPLPVGLFSTIQHVEEIISYKDTARILMFTDGLIGMSHRSLKAGIDRLKLYLLDGHRIENKEFIETILKDLLKKKSLSDDICLISITVK